MAVKSAAEAAGEQAGQDSPVDGEVLARDERGGVASQP